MNFNNILQSVKTKLFYVFLYAELLCCALHIGPLRKLSNGCDLCLRQFSVSLFFEICCGLLLLLLRDSALRGDTT